MMASGGFSNLVNLHGGMHGARDAAGAVGEPGWTSLGFPEAQDSAPERTWEGLS